MSPGEIRQLRERVGMTQREFAEALDVTQATVWRWEAGRAAPQKPREEILRFWRRRLEDREAEKRVQSLLKAGGALGLSFLLDALAGGDEE